MSEIVLEAQGLVKHYSVPRGFLRGHATVRALDGVSFSLPAGRTLAIVGESGCGKSTLARAVTMIEEPTGGRLLYDGRDVVGRSRDELKALRRTVQMVFQNPYGSLNPRKTVGSILAEPLVINTPLTSGKRRERALAMLDRVGLRRDQIDRYPHMFSGGQRQRIAIARALMLRPKIVVLDEPVSALDVSVRAQVLNLLMDLQKEFGLAYIFVSHDLSVVNHIADDVLVLYLGRVVETGPAKRIFQAPKHPYTKALLSATPMADPTRARQRQVLTGEMPSPFAPPPGCVFNPRCPSAFGPCDTRVPILKPVDDQQVACLLYEDAAAAV